jgi:hypothetical protein
MARSSTKRSEGGHGDVDIRGREGEDRGGGREEEPMPALGQEELGDGSGRAWAGNFKLKHMGEWGVGEHWDGVAGMHAGGDQPVGLGASMVGGPGIHNPGPWTDQGGKGGDFNVMTDMQNLSRPAQRRRWQRVAGQYVQLSLEAISDISEYDSEDEYDTNLGDVVNDGIRHEYRDATWFQKNFTYDPKL